MYVGEGFLQTGKQAFTVLDEAGVGKWDADGLGRRERLGEGLFQVGGHDGLLGDREVEAAPLAVF